MILRLVPFLAGFVLGLADALVTAFSGNLFERDASVAPADAPPRSRRTARAHIDSFLVGAGGAGALLTAQGRVGLASTLALAAATGLLAAVAVDAATRILGAEEREG